MAKIAEGALIGIGIGAHDDQQAIWLEKAMYRTKNGIHLSATVYFNENAQANRTISH
jgi:hypothetical protein